MNRSESGCRWHPTLRMEVGPLRCVCLSCRGPLWVRTDKTPCEHNESGYPSIADMRADIDWRRLVPGTDIPRVSLRRGAKKHRIDIWFHTALMPANLITPAHFSVSSAINLLKSAGEPRNAVLPRSHVGVAEGGVDLPVELVDDLDGRISGCADAVPGCVGRARSCRARSGAPHLPAPAERPRPRPHPPLGSRETPP